MKVPSPRLKSPPFNLLFSFIASTFFLVAQSQSDSSSIAPRSWDDSYSLATDLISKLSLDQKSMLLQGNGIFTGPCVGDTPAVELDDGSGSIPMICHSDGPAGLRIASSPSNPSHTSAFPPGIHVAATFNRRLMRERGIALGEEWRTMGSQVHLGPSIDIMRAPGAGRGWEGGGADPYLNAEMGYETVMGVQSQGVQTCVKHFAAYTQEQNRFGYNAQVDNQTLMEMYFLPFRRAIDADTNCVMCSYNLVQGVHACENPQLLTHALRDVGGFRGFVVSDWFASHDSANATIGSGMDVEMPGGWLVVGGGVYTFLANYVRQGLVSEKAVDTALTRYLGGWYKLKQDDGFPSVGFTANGINKSVNARSDAHTQLIHDIAVSGTVLLKNSNDPLTPVFTASSTADERDVSSIESVAPANSTSRTKRGLPLNPPTQYKKIAVIGLDSQNDTKTCDLNACDLGGTIPIGWGSGTTPLTYTISPLTAITNYVADDATLVTSPSQDANKGASAAEGADVALVFVYTFSGEIGAGTTVVDGNPGDRVNLDLWKKGGSLIEAVAGVNNNTIVIAHSVGPVNSGPWADFDNVTGYIIAGLPNEQAGPAIVDILWGNVNPSGRLPYTMAFNESDFGVEIKDEGTVVFSEKQLTDYRHFDYHKIVPRYPFGYGLSYETNFTYSNLSIHSASSDHTKTSQSSSSSETVFTVSLTVTNHGPKSGTEIAQLYLGLPYGTDDMPIKSLKGFEAVEGIGSGETRNVRFDVTQTDVSVWDEASQRFIVPSGVVNIWVGTNSRDLHLHDSFTLT